MNNTNIIDSVISAYHTSPVPNFPFSGLFNLKCLALGVGLLKVEYRSLQHPKPLADREDGGVKYPKTFRLGSFHSQSYILAGF